MRGGLQLPDSYNLTFEERKAISKMAEEHNETTKKTGQKVL